MSADDSRKPDDQAPAAGPERTDGKTPPIPKVRDAGPEEMKNEPPHWDDVDEASDESFPASDPPSFSQPRP